MGSRIKFSCTLSMVAEDMDSNVGKLVTAMVKAAPKFIKIQEAIDKGQLYDLSIGPELTEAATVLNGLRDKGTSIKEYFNQGRFDRINNHFSVDPFPPCSAERQALFMRMIPL